MKRVFVLDENVVMFALQGVGPSGRADETCWSLIEAMDSNCHGYALSSSSWGVYTSQLNRRYDPPPKRFPAVVVKLLKSMLANSEKDTPILPDQNLAEIPGLHEIAHVDSGDVPFVRIAASVQDSILVTWDGDLQLALEENSIPAQWGFSVMSPEAAIVAAQTT